METVEFRRSVISGWMMLITLLVAGLILGWLGYEVINGKNAWLIVGWTIVLVIWTILLCGFFTLQPNVGAVLILFGKYGGTVTASGFHWANPFYLKKKVSLRAHNFNSDKIKVNDLRGNPIEIAAIVVWRVVDTAKATFDVENYESFVSVQSEAALRHLAMSYSYDTFDDDRQITLRGGMEEISASLKKEVQDRVARAGVLIEEARIGHLAYAPEIAGAMLQRQQAEAVVAARTRIVDGAVGMVELALEKLENHKTIKLDEERKAAMVSNLLVVLCSHESATPVVNAGTLYGG